MSLRDRSDFYYCTDSDGKCPSLSLTPARDAWVQYVNNRPVRVKPYNNQTHVWDYANNKMIQMDKCPNLEVKG